MTANIQNIGVPLKELNIEEALSRDSNKDRLILFVPIKCERYMETPEERDKMQKNIRRAFAKTLELLFEPLYRDKLADLGNAKFRRFKISEDDFVEGEIYRKDAGRRFSPLNVEQPIRYMMSFLLAQFAENKKKRSLWQRF